MHGAVAASPGESLAETNKIFRTLSGFSLLLSAVLKLHPSEKNFHLPRLCSTLGVSQNLFQVSFIHAAIQKAIHQTLLLHGNLGPEEGKILALCQLFGGRSEMRQHR